MEGYSISEIEALVESIVTGMEPGTLVAIKLFEASPEECQDSGEGEDKDSINDPDNIHSEDPFEEAWHQAMMIGSGSGSGAPMDFVSSFTYD